jgi:hypothetical protein
MRTAFRISSAVFFAIGVVVIGTAALLVGYSLLVPAQPSPSLNEGHGLAFFLGGCAALVGVVSLSVGAAIRFGLKVPSGSPVAAEPAVADGRGPRSRSEPRR